MYTGIQQDKLNPCPAQFFVFIFDSFKTGIAEEIVLFKWRNNTLVCGKRYKIIATFFV